jgi:hypothetical protein
MPKIVNLSKSEQKFVEPIPWYPNPEEDWELQWLPTSSIESSELITSQITQKNKELFGDFDFASFVASLNWEYIPSLNNTDSIQRRFRFHFLKWSRETRFESSATKILYHKSFLKIIGLGPLAIPEILAEIKKNPSFLFFALELITDEDPTDPNREGEIKHACQCWLDWANKKGLI